MIAGVLLGPSLFGLVAPDAADEVFPAELRPVLYVTGQIGLVAFMFQAGHEFRTHAAGAGRRLAGTALTVSVAGVSARCCSARAWPSARTPTWRSSATTSTCGSPRPSSA
ncbi:hypothetical protein NKH77_20225 [Streptomyces sp. M19]